MEQKYLIDTNVLIDAQMGRLSEKSLNFLAKIVNENFIISFVTYIEYLGYKDISKSSEEFIELAEIIGIDRIIIKKCIDLRKSIKIKLPDAIIAATALAHKLILLTNNEQDFNTVQGLTVINPRSL